MREGLPCGIAGVAGVGWDVSCLLCLHQIPVVKLSGSVCTYGRDRIQQQEGRSCGVLSPEGAVFLPDGKLHMAGRQHSGTT